MVDSIPLIELLNSIRDCTLCTDLPLGPRPVLRAHGSARILVVGQAPGTKVHNTGIPWNDPSGDRLRQWMGVDRETFYDERRIAIMPMGFCYPGRGKSGDLPPRPECAPQWHDAVLAHLPNIELTLLIGQYAQRYYLEEHMLKEHILEESLPKEHSPEKRFTTVTETTRHWQDFLPRFFPLVHPSPRNQLWLRRNPWFEEAVIPALRVRVAALL